MSATFVAIVGREDVDWIPVLVCVPTVWNAQPARLSIVPISFGVLGVPWPFP